MLSQHLDLLPRLLGYLTIHLCAVWIRRTPRQTCLANQPPLWDLPVLDHLWSVTGPSKRPQYRRAMRSVHVWPSVGESLATTKTRGCLREYRNHHMPPHSDRIFHININILTMALLLANRRKVEFARQSPQCHIGLLASLALAPYRKPIASHNSNTGGEKREARQ